MTGGRKRLRLLALGLPASLAAAASPGQDGSRPQPPTEGGWVDVTLARRIAADQHRSAAARRRALVDDIRRRVRARFPGLDDARFERVLSVIGVTPREAFVPDAARPLAYLPTPLKIGWGQTISDAYIVAVMVAELRLPPRAEVLDVGTGSGYQAAILSRLSGRVSSIEIVKPLADTAAARLRRLGYRNVDVRAGDGFAGWPEHAPFDGIVVAAGAADVPAPLLAQLKTGGRLVMPIGPSAEREQVMVYAKGLDGAITRCSLGRRTFVPLTGTGERVSRPATPTRSVPLCHGVDLT